MRYNTASTTFFVLVFFGVTMTHDTDENVKDYHAKCVAIKFKNGACDANAIVFKFEKQNFNFTQISDLRRFAEWIELMSEIQRYAPQPNTLAAVAKHLAEFVRIDRGITRGLQIAGEAVYRAVAELYANYHGVIHFKDTWVRFQIFFNNYIIWTTPTSCFKTLMAMYAHLRKSLRHSPHLVTEIDDAAARLISLTLDYPLTTMRSDHVKQEAYIYYVSKLPSKSDRKRFDGMYETIETQQFPQTTILRSGPVNVTVHHNIRDLDVLNKMQAECDFVYGNFEELWRRLNLSYVHTIFEINMYVYKNRSEYARTGLLLTTNVDNGGIALYQHEKRKVQASVFFENEIIPSAFGHELFHCLLYTSNRRVVHEPNSYWYLEGAANRFGFRKCFWRDYFDLRNYQHKTIDEIVRANYEDNILYPMGSALVSFLYEKRPDLLKSAIINYNYTIESNSQLENEFTLFKHNKLAECDYMIKRHQANRSANNVQRLYADIVSNDTFKHCRNYIAVRFSDCVFVLTPAKLYLENNVFVRSIVNPQKIIRFNRNEVTQFDFDFLQKGIIKAAVRLMLDDRTDPMNVVDKFFSVDDKYSYAANVSCNHEETLASIMMKLPLRSKTPLVTAASKSAAKLTVRRYEKLALECQIFISPPVTTNATKSSDLSEIDLKKPLDVRNNTIIHLAAMHDRDLFLNFYRHYRNLSRMLVNDRNETPIWLFEKSQKYVQHFGHRPNRYCMSIVNSISNDNITIIKPPSSHHVEPPVTADNVGVSVLRNRTKIITEKENKNTATLDIQSVKIGLISITISIVVLTVVGISCNTIITITIVKHYNNKTNNLVASTIQYNKQKFYNNDESTFPLFD